MDTLELKGLLLMARLAGYKTYIAALGLLGLGVFQITQGQVNEGLASIGQAFVAAGLRNALPST
jgi:hypothetical protein